MGQIGVAVLSLAWCGDNDAGRETVHDACAEGTSPATLGPEVDEYPDWHWHADSGGHSVVIQLRHQVVVG